MMDKSSVPGALKHEVARDPRRVHWMELFFDLVFVAFVGQLARGIHGDPGWAEFGTFVLLFFPAWWAWVNIVSVVNLLPGLSSRALGVAMLAAMAAASIMAAAAPGAFGERAWAFSLANAAIRVVLLILWLYQHRENSAEFPWRIWIYNGGTAVLWLLSASLPLHIAVVLWATAIVVEIGMMALSARLWPDRGIAGINIEHASERLGLFVIIVLGESIFTIVTEVSDDWARAQACSVRSDSSWLPCSAGHSSNTARGQSRQGSSDCRPGPISPGSFRPRCSCRFFWFWG
ncbi:uncharacterized protein RA0937 [Arthrobacter sp. Hiyo8]|nr:uncharacterized protein RA0937 [Arthrobacter sp. Hiyo8]